MYSAIREPDGRFFFALHVPPERLGSDHARRALDALDPLLHDLGRLARGEATVGETSSAQPRPERRRSLSARRRWERLEGRLRRSQLLAEAGRALLGGQGTPETLRAVAGLITAHFTDGCIVYLRDGERIAEVTRSFRDDVRSRLADLERWYLPRGAAPDGWIGRVVETGRPQVLSDETQSLDGEPLPLRAPETPRGPGGESAPVLPGAPRRAMVLPLGDPPGPAAGAIAFLTASDGAGYGKEDLDMAEALASCCAGRLGWEGKAAKPRPASIPARSYGRS